MAGGCALQANPRVVQPRPGGCTTKTCCPGKSRFAFRRGYTRQPPVLGVYWQLTTGHRQLVLEHEPSFNHAARLVHVGTRRAEGEPWCCVRCVNNREVPAQEECVLAVSWSQSEGESSAARAVEQVDCARAACALDVLRPCRQRETVFEVVSR